MLVTSWLLRMFARLLDRKEWMSKIPFLLLYRCGVIFCLPFSRKMCDTHLLDPRGWNVCNRVYHVS